MINLSQQIQLKSTNLLLPIFIIDQFDKVQYIKCQGFSIQFYKQCRDIAAA